MRYRSGTYFRDSGVIPSGGPSNGNPSGNSVWAYKDKQKNSEGGSSGGERRRFEGNPSFKDSKEGGPSLKKDFDPKQFGDDKKFDSDKFRKKDGDFKKFDGAPNFGNKDGKKFDPGKFQGDKFKGSNQFKWDGKNKWDGKHDGNHDGQFSGQRSWSKHWDKWHDHDHHHGWVHGHWSGYWNNYYPYYYPGSFWWGSPWGSRSFFWGVSGWGYGAGIYNWGYYPYYNPYCTRTIIIGGAPYSYSQPFATADYPESLEAQASQDFAMARNAFYGLNYGAALASVDSALTKTPQDQAMHEFRALVLFARGEYEPAAATVHSILAVGPGWDWATMRQFYPSVDVYTQQLRALEDFRRSNPRVAHARFLLAYHYLTCGYNDAAAKELQLVVEMEPRDRIASQILGMITHEAEAQPLPSEPDGTPAPPEATIIPQKQPALQAPGQTTPPTPPVETPASKPVDPKAIVGKWNAKQPDGSAIELNLGPDSKFTWKYTREGKTNEYSGNYTLANNILVLQQSEQQAMVGRVEMSPEKGFHFTLLGGPPDDPGLTFTP